VPIVPFAFPKYTMAIPLFQVLSFRLLFNSTSITQSAALTIYRRQKLFIFTGFAIFLSVLIFSPPLLMLFGVMGAVAESFIEITVITAFREWYLRRKVGVSTIGVRALLRIDEMDRLILREFREKLNNALLWRKRYS
jgi:O-antigen/teichoic acid export membrane protein